MLRELRTSLTILIDIIVVVIFGGICAKAFYASFFASVDSCGRPVSSEASLIIFLMTAWIIATHARRIFDRFAAEAA